MAARIAAALGGGLLLAAAPRSAQCAPDARERLVRNEHACAGRCLAPRSRVGTNRAALTLHARSQGTMPTAFDPEALERGAKALREISASPNAKKVRAVACRCTRRWTHTRVRRAAAALECQSAARLRQMWRCAHAVAP
jgi:hypothetical protein